MEYILFTKAKFVGVNCREAYYYQQTIRHTESLKEAVQWYKMSDDHFYCNSGDYNDFP